MNLEGIKYSVESWKAARERGELASFIEPHWRELGLDHQDVPVDMWWEAYDAHEQAGRLHAVFVRDNGVLIGYYTTILTAMLHYKSTLHAVADLYYLKPEYRKSKVGVEMFKFAEEKFRELGVKKIYTGTKLHLNHAKLFEGLGYKPVEMLYTKVL